MNKIVTIIRESRTARFLIPVGIILVIFGIFFLIASNQNKDFIKTESTVTKVEMEEDASADGNDSKSDATYKVSVKYTVEGKEFETELGGVSKYKEGDKMTIYYNPADPSQITQTKSVIIPVIMIVAGIAAFAGGILSGVNAVKRYRKMKKQEEEWTYGK